MLVVESLTHSYGDERVLGGIYLRVEPGEVVGVVGRNGCGKTTMLRALFGSLRADHMQLSVNGERIERAYRSGVVAYLPQEPYLPRRMRVRRVASLALPDRSSRRLVLDHPLVRNLTRARVSRLSGGEQRSLEVLLAMHAPADFILLDEPFTEIEPLHRPAIVAAIRGIATARERGVVITDHAYRDVLAAADRVVVLADGVLRDAPDETSLRTWGYTPR